MLRQSAVRSLRRGVPAQRVCISSLHRHADAYAAIARQTGPCRPSMAARPIAIRLDALQWRANSTSAPVAPEKEKATPSAESGTRPAADTTTSPSKEDNKGKGDKEKKGVAKKEKNLTLMQKVKREVRHYVDGTKLLALETRISLRLAWRMLLGYELTRREQRQLRRTVRDLGRLIPFSLFVIVPFMELLLPIALRLFPNLLPSTYEGSKARQAKVDRLQLTRKDMSKFLRSTIEESGLPLSTATRDSAEFKNFFRKVRTNGEQPSHEDIVKVCKAFKDDVTLDNLSRPQLVAMCKYMNLNTFGSDNMLRYSVRVRMRRIKEDDRQIAYEGLESLNVQELTAACQSRGIRTYATSPAQLREDLSQWLDLRLRYGVPSTLLLLSNAFSYGHMSDHVDSTYDALVLTLTSLPQELYHETELEVSTGDGGEDVSNAQRLQVLQEQERLIQEEKARLEEEENDSKEEEHDSKEDEHDSKEEHGSEKSEAEKSSKEEDQSVHDAQEVAKDTAAAPENKKTQKGVSAEDHGQPEPAEADKAQPKPAKSPEKDSVESVSETKPKTGEPGKTKSSDDGSPKRTREEEEADAEAEARADEEARLAWERDCAERNSSQK